MRILHTSDWHLGRTLQNRSRLPEQEAFVEELKIIVREEKVDLVLVAGDVYDVVNPSAAAEELFYHAISELSENGRRALVIIAGNHDNPHRLRASLPLAHRQGIFLVGKPGETIGNRDCNSPAIDLLRSGPGWFRLGLHNPGQEVFLLTVPFASEARLQEALVDTVRKEEELRDSYDARLKILLQEALPELSPNTVNIFLSHLFVLGSSVSDSERPLHLGGALTVDRDIVHEAFHYAALGHLHRPQQVKRTACPTRYSGSPLAYSFSEAGQEKRVILVEAEPGQQASIQEIPLTSGRPLLQKTITGGSLEALQWLEQEAPQEAWLDLEIHLTQSLEMKDIQAMRQAHPYLVNIRPLFAQAQAVEKELEIEGLSLEELFQAFYSRQKSGASPSPQLMDLFLELAREADIHGSTQGEEM